MSETPVGSARWEHFPHAADVGVRGFGKTTAEAFEQAALALTAVVTAAEIQPAVLVKVQCAAPDIELLFVEWLNAIIYEMAVRKMLFSRFAVKINGARLGTRCLQGRQCGCCCGRTCGTCPPRCAFAPSHLHQRMTCRCSP